MGILKNIYPFILTILITGCSEDFDLDIETKPVLCLNSLFTADDSTNISLTHSWLYTDREVEKNHNVEDAKVTVFVNGKQVGTDYIPQEKDKIRIIAESNKYGKAEAEIIVPQRVPISATNWDAEIISCEKWDNYGDIFYAIRLNIKAKMTLNDPSDIENYYMFSFDTYFEKKETIPDETDYNVIIDSTTLNFISNAEPIFSEHIDQLDAIADNGSYEYTFFTDRQFSGTSYTLNLQFDDILIYINNVESPDDLVDVGLNLTLSSVSQSYYNWYIYQWNTEFGIMGDLSQIGMMEQIWGYSNVSTGAGVVAAKASASYLINLKDILYKILFSLQD